MGSISRSLLVSSVLYGAVLLFVCLYMLHHRAVADGVLSHKSDLQRQRFHRLNAAHKSSPSGDLFVVGDSISLYSSGGFPQKLAAALGIPESNQHITSIGGASLADMLSCKTTPGCSPGGNYPYQVDELPLTFPLGLTSNSKTVLQMAYNDLSNMKGSPNNAQLSYYFGGLKAWILMYAIPDDQKIAANDATHCATTGSWGVATSVPGNGTFPAGTIETTTPGATITCTAPAATDAGFIGLKTVGSSATFTISVTDAGITSNVPDPYTNSTTLNQTAPYSSMWNGISNFYAIGKSGLSDGYISITLTAINNSGDPVYVVAPYFLSPSSVPRNAPMVEVMLESRAGCNGTCSTIMGALHNEANTNKMRAAQIAAVNELHTSGLNVTYFDPNASPAGYNSSDVAQTTRVAQYTVTAGGSRYANGNMTVTGCTIAPTATARVSGGVITPGTYYFTTQGACAGGSPVITFTGGGTGATAKASTISDGTHPNEIGGQNIANAAFANFNSALMAHNRLQASLTGCKKNCSPHGTGTMQMQHPHSRQM